MKGGRGTEEEGRKRRSRKGGGRGVNEGACVCKLCGFRVIPDQGVVLAMGLDNL